MLSFVPCSSLQRSLGFTNLCHVVGTGSLFQQQSRTHEVELVCVCLGAEALEPVLSSLRTRSPFEVHSRTIVLCARLHALPLHWQRAPTPVREVPNGELRG